MYRYSVRIGDSVSPMKRTVYLDRGALAEVTPDDPSDLVWFGSAESEAHLSLTISAREWVQLGRPQALSVDLP